MGWESRPFADLADRLTKRIRLKAGRELFHEGDAFNGRAYLIVEGKMHVLVESMDGTALLLYELGKGDLVGELGFFGRSHRTATVVAAGDVELAEIGRREWAEIRDDPAFDRKSAAHFFHRYAETHRVVKRLGETKAVHRLVVYLLGLREWASCEGSVIEVRLPVHRELAQLIRCTRERVTVLLNELAAQGVIDCVGRSRYRLDRERLLDWIRRI